MKLIDINFLQEYPHIEVSIKNELGEPVALYWSPSQSHNEFSVLLLPSLGIYTTGYNFDKPSLTMVLGDFSTKYEVWFDQDSTLVEGSIMNDLWHLTVLHNHSWTNSHIRIFFFLYDLIFKPTRELIYYCILTAITE